MDRDELQLESDSDLVDLRSLDYVSSYDTHLMCPICRCPFIHPVRLQCDHVFCQKCLDSAITSSGASRDDFKCPTCRAPTTDAFMGVPRLLINMCDDIRVKCPFANEGCAEIVPRGHVRAHVSKYCDYRLVDCPDESCEEKTRKIHLRPEGRCLHSLIRCSSCKEDIMEQDFEKHTKDLCPSLETTCPDCQTTVFRKALAEHIDTCPETVHPCAASKYGCPVEAKRADLVAHQQQCPLITMSPYFEAQNSRLDSLDLTVRHLQQRNEIFEDGLASIRGSLVDASRVTGRRDQSNSNSELNLPSSPDIQNQSQSHPDHPDYPNAITYLLAVHESLRDEITNLSHAITDLDARASMAIMNECLRIKEDMAHTNAAVSSVRMQVQWLMNPRLHQGQRAVRSTAAAAGDGSESSPGPSNATMSPPPAPLRLRRLSDGGREGTKL